MTWNCQIVSWRDIPAQVKIRSGRQRLSRPLGERFQLAIDQAAMHAGKAGSDEYLAEWRTLEVGEREGEPEAVLLALLAEWEEKFPKEKLDRLAARGGWEA
ncbi:MAG: virulence factor [Anaerolineales bacterium]|jgi:hypothetical protein